jgi:hypothetical protein
MEEQQLEKAFRASALIAKHLKHQLTDEEQSELDAWIEECEANRMLFSELADHANLQVLLNNFYKTNTKTAHRRISQKLFPSRNKVLKLVSFAWRYVAAATLLTFIATVLYTSHQYQQLIS